jgi:hypothetical protein
MRWVTARSDAISGAIGGGDTSGGDGDEPAGSGLS